MNFAFIYYPLGPIGICLIYIIIIVLMKYWNISFLPYYVQLSLQPPFLKLNSFIRTSNIICYLTSSKYLIFVRVFFNISKIFKKYLKV